VAASLPSALVEAAPGNLVTIGGTGLGATPTASLGGQLVVHADGSPPTYDGTAILSTAGSSDTTLRLTIPDGVTSGTVTVTATDATTATFPLRVVSQYAQASEYVGEGVDISGLATGELDAILRRASAYVDAYCGAGSTEAPGFRQQQSVELHRFRPGQNRAPRFWPWRNPIVSLDSFVFISSNQIRTKFAVSPGVSSDIYVNTSLGYAEALAYAFGNYVLLGAIDSIGFSANVVEIGYTSGWTMLNYPAPIRQATIMVATEILSYRNIQSSGFGGLSRVKTGGIQYDRRSESFAMPEPVKDLLRPYISRRLA
jgi:hypothetical protein